MTISAFPTFVVYMCGIDPTLPLLDIPLEHLSQEGQAPCSLCVWLVYTCVYTCLVTVFTFGLFPLPHCKPLLCSMLLPHTPRGREEQTNNINAYMYIYVTKENSQRHYAQKRGGEVLFLNVYINILN